MAAAKKPTGKTLRAPSDESDGVTVILMGPDGEPHTFDWNSTDIPDWAAEKIGDHAWVGDDKSDK